MNYINAENNLILLHLILLISWSGHIYITYTVYPLINDPFFKPPSSNVKQRNRPLAILFKLKCKDHCYGDKCPEFELSIKILLPGTQMT